MITKTIKTTSGPLKITIPSDIKELTIGKLQELTPEPGHSYSELEQLSILSGIPTGNAEFDKLEIDVESITLCDICEVDSLRVFDEDLQAIAYGLKHFVTVQKIPKQIKLYLNPSILKNKWWFNKGAKQFIKVAVLKNLGISPAGAYLEAKELIKNEYERWERVKEQFGKEIEFNPSIEAQIRLLSLYFYVPATGNSFNTQKVAEFDSVIKQLSITEALPIARHFFLSYPNLSRPKVKPSIASLKQLKRKQGLKN